MRGTGTGEAMQKVKSLAGSALQVRVGIATGLAVVGDLVGSGEVGKGKNVPTSDMTTAHDLVLYTEHQPKIDSEKLIALAESRWR